MTEPSRALLHRVVIAASALLLFFDLLAFLAGDAPLSAILRGLSATWGTPYGIGQVLYKATPVLFAGVAFDVAYRAGLFNIGAEGQIAIAGLVTAIVTAKLPAGTPMLVGVPIALVVAMAAGGAWASVAGGLRARFGAHEVIGTLLSNRIADAVVPLALAHGFGATSFRTHDVPASILLPRIERLGDAFRGSAASLAFVLAVAVAFATAAWQRRARLGRELGWVGQGPSVCAAEGIPVARRVLLAMVLSGAIAGLSASATVLGYKGHYELGMTSGAGFAGIAVGLLGRGRPWGLLLAALLVGTLQQAGLVLNATIPKESMDILFGVAILAVAMVTARPRPEAAR